MSAKTKSERFRRLISHGFFAPELPPCFWSEGLARYRKYIWDGIEAIDAINGQPAYQKFISQPSWFYFPRHGRDDRRHGVVNPISYMALAKIIADNYITLRRIAKKSRLSASPPVFDWSGPRAFMRSSVDLRDDFRANLASRREQFVVADIRAFFHSIYTHAIPWAIYGKPWAKANRGNQHFGNLIDLLCRNAQDGQTIGLPVGPDTSRFIAEVVASAIDADLQRQLDVTGQDASRYIDDFTIGCDQEQTGESLIATIRQAVGNFELELNNEKSAIHATSIRFETGWKQAALANLPRAPYSYESFQRFFYEIGRLAETHPNINVEKFAYQNARSALLRTENWKKIQDNIINCYRRNPSMVSFLVEICILRNVERGDVDLSNLEAFLNGRFLRLARENRTGELIWLLFLAIRLSISISAVALEQACKLENAMVALLVSQACSEGRVAGQVNFQMWNRFLNADGLRSGMWLYAYESVRAGINVAPSDFIQEDAYFGLLWSKKVSFLAVDRGFSSIATTLRDQRDQNAQMRRLRRDFLSDFSIDIEEVDDEGDEDEEFGAADY